LLLAIPALALAGGLSGCDSRTGPGTPPATPATTPVAPTQRPAVAVAPELGAVLSVTAVNDAGAMVLGRAGPTGPEFFFVARGGQPKPLLLGDAPIEPSLLNNAGQVVGVVADRSGSQPSRLVRWQDGTATVLPVTGDEIIPEDLNDRGQVTAVAVARRPGADASSASDATRAFLIDGTRVVDLGIDPDINERNLYLNESGQVAGQAFTDAGTSPRGFLWDNGAVITFDTGPTAHPVVMGLNDAGQLAGLSLDDQDSPSGAHPLFRPAFRWQSGILTFLDAGPGAGVGPVRINRSGQVAAVAADTSGAARDVVVWSADPAARPTRLGITNADLVVGLNDRGDVLLAGTAGPTAAPAGYVWHGGRVDVLGPLGGVAADPRGLAADGLAAGTSTSADGSLRAAAWPPVA